jgi:catechol 2,3-dioxygenase-like lactoylglutathione lyase family enzyme
MSRIHVALNTNRFEESVEFYSKLFGSDPAKLHQGWAKFDLRDPALNLTLNRSDKTVHHGDINHLGIEVDDSETVAAMDQRLRDLGLSTLPEDDVTCCYARQDKTWVQDPNGNSWEFFYVKADV